ncbi:MAG: hypothetical protein SFX19_06875 [Alphaproteobacteria bacterium]|nr:hypothetical protein [Alphaproteobacteria bacterium]
MAEEDRSIENIAHLLLADMVSREAKARQDSAATPGNTQDLAFGHDADTAHPVTLLPKTDQALRAFYQPRSNLTLEQCEKALDLLIEQGYVRQQAGMVAVTDRGKAFAELSIVDQEREKSGKYSGQPSRPSDAAYSVREEGSGHATGPEQKGWSIDS